MGLFSLEKRRLQEHLIAACQYLSGAYKKGGEGLFARACCDRTKGNGFKLKMSRFRLDEERNFFTVRVLRHDAERSCGCLLTGSFHGLVVWGFE